MSFFALLPFIPFFPLSTWLSIKWGRLVSARTHSALIAKLTATERPTLPCCSAAAEPKPTLTTHQYPRYRDLALGSKTHAKNEGAAATAIARRQISDCSYHFFYHTSLYTHRSLPFSRPCAQGALGVAFGMRGGNCSNKTPQHCTG